MFVWIWLHFWISPVWILNFNFICTNKIWIPIFCCWLLSFPIFLFSYVPYFHGHINRPVRFLPFIGLLSIKCSKTHFRSCVETWFVDSDGPSRLKWHSPGNRGELLFSSYWLSGVRHSNKVCRAIHSLIYWYLSFLLSPGLASGTSMFVGLPSPWLSSSELRTCGNWETQEKSKKQHVRFILTIPIWMHYWPEVHFATSVCSYWNEHRR